MKRRNRRQKSASPNAGESGPDSDSEVDRDSSYSSQSDRESDADAKAMYYQQKMNEFEEAGVTLSNPCDETKAMMEAELEVSPRKPIPIFYGEIHNCRRWGKCFESAGRTI